MAAPNPITPPLAEPETCSQVAAELSAISRWPHCPWANSNNVAATAITNAILIKVSPIASAPPVVTGRKFTSATSQMAAIDTNVMPVTAIGPTENTVGSSTWPAA